MKRAGTHGKGRRKKKEIHSRAGRFFLKVTALFLNFLCSKSFVAFISLFLSIKTFSLWSKKYFYAFCGVLVVSLACMVFAREDSQESTVDYFDSSFRELWFEGW